MPSVSVSTSFTHQSVPSSFVERLQAPLARSSLRRQNAGVER
jgi:hypothetical protein